MKKELGRVEWQREVDGKDGGWDDGRSNWEHMVVSVERKWDSAELRSEGEPSNNTLGEPSNNTL